MLKVISNVVNNLFYVLSGNYKADKAIEKKFHEIWEKRMEQRMSPEFDWDTMTHPDDPIDGISIDESFERLSAYRDADIDEKLEMDKLQELF